MNDSFPVDKSNLTEIARDIFDYLLYLQGGGVYGLSNQSNDPHEIVARDATPPSESFQECKPYAPDASPNRERQLMEIKEKSQECTRCNLHVHRTQAVFGIGDLNPEIVFVGDGPGEEDDRMGTPFAGAAGQLLTRIITAMGLTRDQVYLCNILKCQLPRDRTPERDEFRTCLPFLEAQIQILKPKVIVALGELSAVYLTNHRGSMQQLRTQSSTFCGIPVRATYHPADQLANTELKRLVWHDVKLILRFLGKPVPGESHAKA